MHLLGQSTILTLSNDLATGEVYCMPHHLTVDGTEANADDRRPSVRGHVCEAKGHVAVCRAPPLYVDWIEQRALS